MCTWSTLKPFKITINMKKYIFLLAVIFTAAGHSFAQLNKRDLPVVFLPANVSVHFVSPEPIRFVDISVKDISGDLPVPNILRIYVRDSVTRFSDAVVTITGEKFIAQYRVVPCQDDHDGTVQTEIAINPPDCRPLDNPEIGLSQPELKANALRLLAMRPSDPVEKVKAFGMQGALFHIYTLGDYIFLDLGFHNQTKLSYTIDQLHFSIEDKKVTKASTVQSVPVLPLFVLQDIPAFEKYYRNIFVFKKLTFPGNKIFSIGLSEKQLSGRTLTLKADYKDLLRADVFPK
jgi:conjugative transposon TraN protein